ncbi:hypothetical protein HN903_02475 [archaeon]|jgi:hypothetical protein|nr:hypothetical protein [archaeon]MBT7128597.1 hypothetical protein [archaeon]
MSTDFDILPDKVEVIKYHRFENKDIQSEGALNELISLMFDHPERDFYVFTEKNSKPNSLLMKANKDGSILINEVELFYYRHPRDKHSFIRIPRGGGEFEWEKELTKQGPMFQRTKLKLTARMKRQLEALNKIALEKRSDSFPIELKPNLFGLGLDLNKLFRFVRQFFGKRR